MDSTSSPVPPHRLANFIAGEFIPPLNTKDDSSVSSAPQYLSMVNPSTGLTNTLVPISTNIDVDRAVSAAFHAYSTWSETTPQTRSKLLHAIADGIERRLEQFALAESADQGKPVQLARAVDIPRAIHNFRFFASAILHSSDNVTHLHNLPGYSPNSSALNYTQRQPIGVAGLISPWNLPLYLLTWKIAPCIATGNTCVCKPSEFTSHTAYLLCQVLQEVNAPNGVINMVFGDGPTTGSALVAHPNVPLISFTGGTSTGAIISKVASPMFKKLSLELGGKNAAIIFPDAKIDRAILTTMHSSFRNQGEICLCTSRIFVHRSIYEKFVNELVTHTEKLKVGDPVDHNTDIGALVSESHMNKVLSYISLGQQEGGNIRTGGYRITANDLPTHLKNGYYVAPTIITDLSPNSRCMQEEIFGPVTCVYPFDTEDQVVQWTNGTKYGLAATLWTNNVHRAHRISGKLNVGTVWVNCWMVRDLNMPFGGVKNSGLGREGWPSSLDFFTEEKTICVAISGDQDD